MNLRSTNQQSPSVAFSRGILNGLARDGGLYMPERLMRIPQAFFRNIQEMTLHDVAFVVLNSLLGDEIQPALLKTIVKEAVSYDVPLVRLTDGQYLLEMYDGPSHSFKDLGARVMAALTRYLAPASEAAPRTVILATTGDSAAAVAQAFAGEPHTRVVVLYPKDDLNPAQIAQFADMPGVKSVEVDGKFDQCQAIVKEALKADAQRVAASGGDYRLTSGNSINLARELPAVIYFFHAYARAKAAVGEHKASEIVISIPCGNLGTLTAALIAKQLGLPVKRFIAANNANDVFVEYLKTGGFRPRQALETLARAMDVGNPSNIARIISLYDGNLERLRADVTGYSYTDAEIAETMKECANDYGIPVDPQGALAVRAMERHLEDGETGVALATVHPWKFRETIAEVTGISPQPPAGMKAERVRIHTKPVKIPPTIEALRRVLASLQS